MSTTSDSATTHGINVRGPHSRFAPSGGAAVGSGPLVPGNGTADDLVRALSHDMTAYFMLLDHSIQRLKETAVEHAGHANETPPAPHIAAKFAQPRSGAQATGAGRAAIGELAERFAHVEACLRESRRFLADLVTLARTGGIEMEPCRVELSRTVQETLYEQRELLDERGIQVTVDPNLPAVWCNPARVKQVLTNLIRNAAKHGCSASEPQIIIARRGKRCQEPNPGLDGNIIVEPADSVPDTFFPEWFVVYDNGPGIPAAAREEVFLPGRRLPGAHPEGTGMGLSIVRRIVEYYGGQVLVDPQVQAGTAIVFSFPAVQSS